jgi:hypothetical protein
LDKAHYLGVSDFGFAYPRDKLVYFLENGLPLFFTVYWSDLAKTSSALSPRQNTYRLCAAQRESRSWSGTFRWWSIRVLSGKGCGVHVSIRLLWTNGDFSKDPG